MLPISVIIRLAVSGVLCALFLVLRVISANKAKAEKIPDSAAGKKKKNRGKLLFTAGLVVSAWYFIGTVIGYLSGLSGEMKLELEVFPGRTEIFGLSVSDTTLLLYGILALVLVLALLFRFVAFPRFRERDVGTLQLLAESAVTEIDKFCGGATHGALGESLSSYMLAVAVLMMFSAGSELFGFRAPTSDLLVTLSLALCTFFLINYYGLKKKGIVGRLKSFANPTPVVAPFKVVSDIATPVSLACRLFGNMLGGMIVLDLLKSSLGAYAFGIPAVAGLYFNLFHPLIQTYIFIILSLTFINEAVE